MIDKLICLILVVMVALFTFSHLRPFESRVMIDDLSMEKEGFERVDAVRYVGTSAAFSRIDEPELVLYPPPGTTSIELRVWDFEFGPVRVSARGGDAEYSDSLPGEGVGLTSLVFESQEGFVGPLEFDFEFAERPAFLIDTATYTGPSMMAWWLFSGFLVLVPVVLFTIGGQHVALPNPTTGRVYPTVDIVRAIAVLLVVILHARGYSSLGAEPPENFFDQVAMHGHFGVEVFYVLSAYTLTFSLLSQASREVDRPLQQFWTRRMARILPALLVLFLAISAVKILFANQTYDLGGLAFRLFTMTYIYDDSVRLMLEHSVWWSVATEFQFYLLMPILFAGPIVWAQKTDGHTWLTAFVILICGLAVTTISQTLLVEKGWLGRSILYHALPFAAGISLAIVVARDQEIDAPVWIRGGALALAISALVLVIGLYKQIDLVLRVGDVRLGIMAVVAASCVLIAAARWFDEGSDFFKRFVSLRSIGVLSFLIYLLHIPMMQALVWVGIPATSLKGYYSILVIASVTFSWIVGFVVHRAIEAPVLARTSLIASHPLGVAVTYGYVLALLLASFFSLAIF